jgi:orotate phosphoribosyltransferase
MRWQEVIHVAHCRPAPRWHTSPGERKAHASLSPSAPGVDLSALASRVYATSHLTGSFRLRSGQTSSEYFDKYLFEADPALLREVAAAMVPLLPDCDVLAGMELGGIPLATVLSQLTGLPTCFVRKQAKEYGTCKVAEGADVAGLRVVVVEDVVTTGGALLQSCADLRGAGALIDTVVCAIDREQGGTANLTEAGLDLRAALTRSLLEQTSSHR